MNSLYVQITTKCNMACPHCCFSCGKRGGEHMDALHFAKVIAMLQEDDSCMVTIGGGEPTMHPDCMDFLWQTIRACLPSSDSAGTSVVGIVTNGTIEKRALEIARMAEMGMVSARLSYDKFHEVEKVSERVKRAFGIGVNRTSRRENDLRNVNQWEYFVTPHGRALETGIYNHPFSKVGSCNVEGLFITPDGTLWQCGCRKKAIAHLNDDINSIFDAIRAVTDEDDGEIKCSQKI